MKKLLFFSLISLYQITSYANASSLDQVSNSIFKIFTFHQTVKLKSPWQRKSPFESSGTGFLIDQNRIVTNAHVVRNARYIEIKKPGDAKRYLASIAFIAHSSDLALLHVKDPSFFENLTPLSFGDIPKLDSSVKTIGYPIGGNRLSVTNGVVSRIEKVLYSHSRIDEHLGIQTDAAINPGNSGGPVLQSGEVIGVAFQGIQSGDNIGYMIPTTVVHHFLKDSEDGKIDGTPEAGIRFISLPPVIRDYLKFPTNENGIFVVGTTEKGATQGILQKNDIVTHINGINIMDDGRIKLNDLLVDFYEIIERSQFNDKFNVRWFRKGEFTEKEITLKEFPLLINPGKKYPNQRPYLIFHGLVFVKLTGDYMRGFGKGWWEKLPQIYRSIYYYPEKYANDFKREYPMVLSNILKHPSNAHSSSFINKAIDSVNGLTIHSFSDLSKAFKSPQNGFHVIKFLDTKVPLILDASISEMTHHKLLKTYNIKNDKLIESQKL